MRIFDRLSEPSSWAALAAAGAVLGLELDPGLWDKIVMAGAGLSALAGVLDPTVVIEGGAGIYTSGQRLRESLGLEI